MSDFVEQKKKLHESSWENGYKIFPEILNKYYKLKTGAEIGVAFGGHAEALLKNTGIIKLHGVDPYLHRDGYDDPMNFSQSQFDSLYNYTINRLSLFGDRYSHIRKESIVAVKDICDEIDFVYIDAEHSYNGVYTDICTWFPKIRIGGLIAGHDYGHSNFPGVKQAVDEFFRRFDWKVNVEEEGVWWVEKKALNLSIIIPAFNCETTVTETIESIININLTDGDEIIIVDDASTDGTKDIVDRYADRFDFIHVVSHCRNKGGAVARNTAVESAHNELIFCLDSDNVLVEGSLKKLKSYLIEQSADVASFQELHYFNNCITDMTHRWVFKRGQITFADCLAGFVVPIASGNYLFTKESWLRAGGYPEFAGALDAWGFGLRQVATGSKMVVLPDSFYFHRCGHESYWVRDSKKGNISLTALQIVIPYIDLIVDKDINYIVGCKERRVWFEQLDKRPLRLKSGEVGSVGYVVNPSESSAIHGDDINLAKWLKGFLILIGGFWF